MCVQNFDKVGPVATRSAPHTTMLALIFYLTQVFAINFPSLLTCYGMTAVSDEQYIFGCMNSIVFNDQINL